jgi:NHL repeat
MPHLNRGTKILPFIVAGILIFARAMAAQVVFPSNGDIATIAGNGVFGYSGNGVSALSAEVRPSFSVLDQKGNIYFSDYGVYIREISRSTGIITTIAGNGTSGDTGDGGPATSAGLDCDSGLAIDLAGNLYCSGLYGEVVRQIHYSLTRNEWIITRVAGTGTAGYSGDGGPAINAELHFPSGLALDNSGNLYIADEGNARIRKVSAATGIITTIAGTGTFGYSGDGGPAINAEFSSGLAGMAVDAAGDVFIADQWNNRIREIAASTGKITTVAGTGSAGYSGDGGPATSAEIYSPVSVAIDQNGNLFIGDDYNYRVREVNTSGVVSTIAGDGTDGYSGDGGYSNRAELNGTTSSVDTSGHLYISDYGNARLRVVTGTPPPAPPPPPPPQVATPWESGVIVTVNGIESSGFEIATSFICNGELCSCPGGSCISVISNNPESSPILPPTYSGANSFSVSYSVTLQDATPGAEIYADIIENGVSHPYTASSGGTISIAVLGGTTLTGTMYAVANGHQSLVAYLSF